jgi:hypothetical protein
MNPHPHTPKISCSLRRLHRGQPRLRRLRVADGSPGLLLRGQPRRRRLRLDGRRRWPLRRGGREEKVLDHVCGLWQGVVIGDIPGLAGGRRGAGRRTEGIFSGLLEEIRREEEGRKEIRKEIVGPTGDRCPHVNRGHGYAWKSHFVCRL